jgi:ABC-type cobalamin/Fe3+-siderophores transport system ATPase subunit
LAILEGQYHHTGTGFGKSCIAEMYLSLFATKDGVILVLNPLDALGDNQLAKKIALVVSSWFLDVSSWSDEQLVLVASYNQRD